MGIFPSTPHTILNDLSYRQVYFWATYAMVHFTFSLICYPDRPTIHNTDLPTNTQQKPGAKPLRVAVTGAAGLLGRALLPKIAAQHQVVATDLNALPGEQPIEACDVRDSTAAQTLCADVDAVVHLAAATWSANRSARENETLIFDTRLKGTYNILQAAQQAGVRRVIQISDLCVFSGYDSDIMVSEDFIPQPATEAHPLSVYLSELMAREYARLSCPGHVLTLRLGQLVDPQTLADDARCADGWLAIDDAVDAILHGLQLEHFSGMGEWGIYNLAADVPDNRYSLLKIQSNGYGFFPRENFAAWREA